MKRTGCNFFFFCCCCFLRSASGKPLQTASPGRAFAAVGGDVVLPCRLTTSVEPSGVTAVDWSRVDGPSPLTVHVVRDGKELVKEKAPQYLGRTAILEDGSLKLLGVQRRDSGSYRFNKSVTEDNSYYNQCVLLRHSSVEDEVFVSLSVAQVSQVTLSVRRTSANQLLVRCESGGWSLEPVVSLLDSDRTVLAAQTESSVRPDRLFSVSAVVNVAAAAATQTGSRTVTCRVEVPGTSLAKEDTLHISDELDPSQEGLGRWLVLVAGGAFVLVCVVVSVVVFIVPVGTIEKLRSSVQRLRVRCVSLVTREGDGRPQEYEPLLGEYGDINMVDTTGASEMTAMVNQLSVRGVEASNRLAERDLRKMLDYKETIISQGQTLGVAPALIAAIISRQSQAGTLLNSKGFGRSDNNCFGLMQISKSYHAVKGSPFSKEHVDEGVTIFIEQVKTMRRKNQNWNKEQQLKGALACYVSGADRVSPLEYDEVDSVTPNEDFANDVVARAQWFARNGF